MDNIYYPVNAELAVIEDLSYLYGVVTQYSEHLNNPFDWIFIEVPGVLSEAFPLDKLRETDLVLLVARANKKWNDADEKALQQLRRGSKSKPKLLLNACRADVLEDIIGEIPKKRSRMRRMIKRYASFKMGEKQTVDVESRHTVLETKIAAVKKPIKTVPDRIFGIWETIKKKIK